MGDFIEGDENGGLEETDRHQARVLDHVEELLDGVVQRGPAQVIDERVADQAHAAEQQGQADVGLEMEIRGLLVQTSHVDHGQPAVDSIDVLVADTIALVLRLEHLQYRFRDRHARVQHVRLRERSRVEEELCGDLRLCQCWRTREDTFGQGHAGQRSRKVD